MTNQQVAAQILESLSRMANKIGALEESQRSDRRELDELKESINILVEKVGSLAKFGYQLDSGAVRFKDIEQTLKDLSEEVEILSRNLNDKNIDIGCLKCSLEELDKRLQGLKNHLASSYISRSQIKDWILNNLWAVILFLIASVIAPYLAERLLLK